ncbi:MAG: hypothetical protein KDA84_12210, partial [Planctomycetaceae bacterium]|nr:hypothetical protein [Planctomycetaceae bacterium]
MGNNDGLSIRLPFQKEKIPVTVEIEEHPAIAGIENWSTDLKDQIATACFRSYQDKLNATGPEGLTQIGEAAEVWDHLVITDVRISPAVPDSLLIYVIPEWDKEEHMEWCIQDGQLVYVGQFLG